jgi:hypothetical protein
MGTLTVSNGGAFGSAAEKKLPSSNITLSALVAKKDPPIFNLALGPKTMPAGLTKNRFAAPLARINPSILDILPPVTRLRIF